MVFFAFSTFASPTFLTFPISLPSPTFFTPTL